MKVEKYEIDVLDVGAADAILIHFFDENNNEYIVSIDAGNYNDGKLVSDFIKEHYGTRDIDLAICTHCDADHYGGYIWMLEDKKSKPLTSVSINKFWINDPGVHVDVDDYKYRRNPSGVKKEARSVYTLPGTNKNLLDIIDEMGIYRSEAFSKGDNSERQAFARIMEVMGPTREYYEKLVPDFRNNLRPYDDDSEDDDNVACDKIECLSKAMDDASDDASAHNQSSIVILFKPSDGKKYLFTGDMGEDAFNNMLEVDLENVKNVWFLKVPHHGSKHNLCSNMIHHFNPVTAYISSEKYGRYLSKAVVNALNNVNCRVLSTNLPWRGSLQYRVGLDYHKGYGYAPTI